MIPTVAGNRPIERFTNAMAAHPISSLGLGTGVDYQSARGLKFFFRLHEGRPPHTVEGLQGIPLCSASFGDFPLLVLGAHQVNRFERVKEILDSAVGGELIGAHGAFWRGTTRNEFVAKSVFGFPLIVLSDGAGSNLVKALRGEASFGSDLPSPPTGAIFSRMPSMRSPVAPDEIDFIRQRIDDDCPDEVDRV